MKLAYEAYDRAGKRVRDVVEAVNANEATEKLRKEGMYITTIRAAGQGETPVELTGRKIPAGKRLKHIVMFARQLQVLVSTGTPLVEAIAAVERQVDDMYWRGVLEALRTRVEEGAGLADAMAEHQNYFDPITRSLVAAGESAGKLPEMLGRVATITRKAAFVRTSVIGAMVYPVLLITVAMGVLVMLLMFVLPRFAVLFEELDAPLPPTTALLMGLSDFLLAFWWTLPIAVVGGVIGLRIWLKSPSGKRTIDTFMIRMPMFGKLVQSFQTARIIRLMGILLDSFLPLLDVLKLVKESTTNHHYHQLLVNAEEAVTRGEAISSAFNDPSLIQISVYESMRSGEASGQIGPLLVNLAEFLDEDNEVVVKSLASILEPVILIVLGALVGFVSISMFLPLFDMTAMAGSS